MYIIELKLAKLKKGSLSERVKNRKTLSVAITTEGNLLNKNSFQQIVGEILLSEAVDEYFKRYKKL